MFYYLLNLAPTGKFSTLPFNRLVGAKVEQISNLKLECQFQDNKMHVFFCSDDRKNDSDRQSGWDLCGRIDGLQMVWQVRWRIGEWTTGHVFDSRSPGWGPWNKKITSLCSQGCLLRSTRCYNRHLHVATSAKKRRFIAELFQPDNAEFWNPEF